MKTQVTVASRSRERGAITIKALFMLVLTGLMVFVLIKAVPIYVEQREVLFDVDELARLATIRGWKDDKIKVDIDQIRAKYTLPEGSINLLPRDQTVHIAVAYKRDIDFMVTSYAWKVDYTAIGKEM